jgi:hypothetical protein
MELYTITTATKSYTGSWNHVCDLLATSHDGDAWQAHTALEDLGEYTFQNVYGDQYVIKPE